MIFLNGCNFPQVKKVERCLVSLEHDACICHNYAITKKKVGSTSKSIIHDLEYCEKMIGFRPKEWVTIGTWIKDVFAWVDRNEPNSSLGVGD